MKNISIIFIAGFATFFFSASAYTEKDASSGTKGSMKEAIKHLKMAKENKNDANAILKHAEMSLKHLEVLDKEERNKSNNRKDHDIPGAIMNLEEAITHAEMGNIDVAKKHIDNALNDIH